jgi:hypothetical protein
MTEPAFNQQLAAILAELRIIRELLESHLEEED